MVGNEIYRCSSAMLIRKKSKLIFIEFTKKIKTFFLPTNNGEIQYKEVVIYHWKGLKTVENPFSNFYPNFFGRFQWHQPVTEWSDAWGFYSIFNSAFWLSITALTFTFLGLVIKTCCSAKKLKLCGFIIIERDGEEEVINTSVNDFIPIHTT